MSHSACRTQFRSVSPVKPILAAIERITPIFRAVLALVVEHHPRRAFADLRRKGCAALRHGSILLRIKASGKPGTVQPVARPTLVGRRRPRLLQPSLPRPHLDHGCASCDPDCCQVVPALRLGIIGRYAQAVIVDLPNLAHLVSVAGRRSHFIASASSHTTPSASRSRTPSPWVASLLTRPRGMPTVAPPLSDCDLGTAVVSYKGVSFRSHELVQQ